MTIKAGRNRRFLLTKNLILMLVMIVLIILASMSWFTLVRTVRADNIVVKAISSEVDIAPSLKTYNSSNQLLTDGPGEFGSELSFNGPYTFTKDCTGDGSNLIVPEFNVTKDPVTVKQVGKEVNTNLNPGNAHSDFSRSLAKVTADNVNLGSFGLLTSQDIKDRAGDDISEYQYIEEDFYVRSKNKDLLLTGDSQLLSATEVDGHNLSEVSYTKSGVSYNKKSAYGNFNYDGLVGGIRVALIGKGATSVNQTWNNVSGTNTVTATSANFGHDENNKSEVKQILWLPRPDVMLNVSGGEDVTNWSLSTGLSSGDSYTNTYYRKKANETGVELVSNDTDAKTKVSSGTYEGHKSLGNNVNISDFSSYENTGGSAVRVSNLVKDKTNLSDVRSYYVTKYTLKVWIEGTDAEARRAMDGGSFNLTLKFM